MHYRKGDTPAAPIPVMPVLDGAPVDLELYETVQAQLVQPDGTLTDVPAVILPADDPEGPAVEVTLEQLEQAGIVGITLRLTGPGVQSTFDAEPIVVEDPTGWHTIGSAHGEWEGSRHLGDARLFTLLEAAREACVAYKPEAGKRAPSVTEREAQLVQARNRSAASRVDPATGDDGVNGYSVTPFPMDWTVKALLRPRTRFGGIR